MQVRISVVGGAADGLQLTLDQLPITLGREGDPSLPIGDRWASRHHCELFEHDGQLLLRDLASKHGTYVNGACVDQCQLHPGDRVMIGLTMIVIDEIAGLSIAEGEALVDRESGVGA